jgi:hypothetical protein
MVVANAKYTIVSPARTYARVGAEVAPMNRTKQIFLEGLKAFSSPVLIRYLLQKFLQIALSCFLLLEVVMFRVQICNESARTTTQIYVLPGY